MNFHQNIAGTKQQMTRYKGKKDSLSVKEFFLKPKPSMLTYSIKKKFFWKQRSKEFWLVVGDLNTKYFHAMPSVRRKNNRIFKL